MSFDVTWDVDKYREDHESEEHWELRKAFMMRWKNDYPEERLVCLARVFTNMEFMGCRYPPEIMHQVSQLSQEVAKSYRNSRKNKLKRTFVAASTAAEDRAKGVKREGGVLHDEKPAKSSRIEFVRSGQEIEETPEKLDNTPAEISDNEEDNKANSEPTDLIKSDNKTPNIDYLEEMSTLKCLDPRGFREEMFETSFGRLVLLIRPWSNKWWNLQTSCNVCGVPMQSVYAQGCFTLHINGQLVARATGETKLEARSIVEIMAWNRIREEVISVVVKEQWIAQGDARISLNEVSSRAQDVFGTPVDNSVATKMMKLMGWKGGGLGADAQGIAEPIKPNLQMVNRAGLGSNSLTDIRALRRAGAELMRRYIASDTIDVDLVFSSEFSKDERATLHQIAQRNGLASRSYGDKDRFLVVKKKLDPFSLARAVIEKGGVTPKYQAFIPAGLQRRR